jgi:ABC-2 type transport system permease protein
MLRNVLLKTIRDQRRALMWWSMGVAAMVLFTVPFYPSLRDQADSLNKYMQEMPEALRAIFIGEIEDITSPEGFLNSQIFIFMAPLLLSILAIGAGARAIAGEERAGTLDLLLSTPVPRRRVVIHTFAAMVVSVAVVGLALWVSLAIAGAIWDVGVPASRTAAAVGTVALLGIVFGSLSLAIGAATGSRGSAIGVAAAVGVAGYLVNSLAPLVDLFRDLKVVSPFNYYGVPLTTGFDVGDAIVLAAMSLVMLGASAVALEGRDLGVR